MSLPPLAMSESKAKVMARLGLTGPNGESYYRLLLEEASTGRDRLSNNYQNLNPYLPSNMAVQAPYKWDELAETARHLEVLNIVRSGTSYTAPFYQMGTYWDGSTEENWVAKWFLWHAFRYRDNKSNAAATSAQGQRHDHGGNPKPFWDPVHETYFYY